MCQIYSNAEYSSPLQGDGCENKLIEGVVDLKRNCDIANT